VLWVRVTPLDGELAVASHWVVMLAMTTGEIIGTIIFAIGFIAFIAYYSGTRRVNTRLVVVVRGPVTVSIPHGTLGPH